MLTNDGPSSIRSWLDVSLRRHGKSVVLLHVVDSSPSNRMWKLLTSSGIVPPHFTSVNDDDCPWACGVGFTDLVGIDASPRSSQTLTLCTPGVRALLLSY